MLEIRTIAVLAIGLDQAIGLAECAIRKRVGAASFRFHA
jgi:hypothetical protein